MRPITASVPARGARYARFFPCQSPSNGIYILKVPYLAIVLFAVFGVVAFRLWLKVPAVGQALVAASVAEADFMPAAKNIFVGRLSPNEDRHFFVVDSHNFFVRKIEWLYQRPKRAIGSDVPIVI